MSFAVFAAFAALYLATLAPGLAPWRDTGEMAAATATLSVAHPTSYPAYVLLGRLAHAVPLGNPAYRLNILSAAAAALACAALFSAVRRRWGAWAGAGAALLLGLNPAFWAVAQVQEMYSLWALLAVLLMALALRLSEGYDARLWRVLCFGAGLALANRLDLLLWAPGLLWVALSDRDEARSPVWASLALLVFPALQAGLGANWPIVPLIALTVWWRRPAGRGWRWACASAGWVLAGLSLYLFLPVRSAGGPWLDWNHPSALSNFLDSILRTRYGGTLDLLSKSYKTGELFGDNLLLYGKHLWAGFSAPGLALVIWGAATASRREPRRFLGQLACWWWAGPVFLFLANLPPTPHAAAIVEPHYLLSEIVLVYWAAEGLGALAPAFLKDSPSLRSGAALAGPAFAAALLAVPLALGRGRDFDRREHLFSYDYARLVFDSAPQGAIVVAKKDVQLYALWSYQRLQGWRPDVRVIAQGLAGSPWYQADWRRRDPSVSLLPLADEDAWRRFCALNGGAIFVTPDAEIPTVLAREGKPRGMLLGLGPKAEADASPWLGAVRRGLYDYDFAQDFFTSDLVDSRAQAALRAGMPAAVAGKAAEAEPAMLSAWAMHWLVPEPALYLGYLNFSAGKMTAARRFYLLAELELRELLDLADRYRSLPAVVDSLRRSLADALAQRGVIEERLGRREDALACYETSLRLAPSAQAHYDIAVLFWGRDWARVETELAQALQLDPRHAEAARYLTLLRSKKR